ncbi:MAG: hypothetical protein EBV15_09885 [Bacteroidetes bacterium]|jgi:hypothetical protein|nr:hypothetical protein [Bacteroidota bacterium]
MLEIGDDELKVLNCLLHPESMETVVSETKFHPKVALDIVRTLVHYRYVKAQDVSGKSLAMFSPDKLTLVRFVLTAKGLKEITSAQQPPLQV